MEEAESITRLIEAAVREMYGKSQGPIPLHSPYFKGSEWEYVRSCLESGWVSSAGSYVERLEQEIEHFTGTRNAIATVNGTSALYMALLVSGIEAGDEVLCPAFSFVGTVTPVIYCGAYPVFMDSDARTMGIDPKKILEFISDRCVKGKDGLTYDRETGRKVKACIPVHTY
ncbi:MAG: DegT/DnrJ/EryC1/StrS family aminotransferase, partial [Deltaproteobacteria bacterium]|nr:DegT/DnrJ/EryC1/StrS family aminotransferase [Deltaproteobacteria bacterium]